MRSPTTELLRDLLSSPSPATGARQRARRRRRGDGRGCGSRCSDGCALAVRHCDGRADGRRHGRAGSLRAAAPQGPAAPRTGARRVRAGRCADEPGVRLRPAAQPRRGRLGVRPLAAEGTGPRPAGLGRRPQRLRPTQRLTSAIMGLAPDSGQPARWAGGTKAMIAAGGHAAGHHGDHARVAHALSVATVQRLHDRRRGGGYAEVGGPVSPAALRLAVHSRMRAG